MESKETKAQRSFNITHYHVKDTEKRGAAIGLSLSGGGFRASMFHLGALKRLNEMNILKYVDTVASVSGGSITAAILAMVWPNLIAHDFSAEAFEKYVQIPTRKFCRHNFALSSYFDYVSPTKIIRQAVGTPNTEFLAERFIKAAEESFSHLDEPDKTRLKKKMSSNVFDALPDPMPTEAQKKEQRPVVPPLFVIETTDMRDGSAFYFTKHRSGRRIYSEKMWKEAHGQQGDIQQDEVNISGAEKQEWLYYMDDKICESISKQVTFAQVIAASAAFPVTFQPLTIQYKVGKEVVTVPLADGGLFDNLAIDPLLLPNCYRMWNGEQNHEILLLSNASAPFHAADQVAMTVGSRTHRSINVIINQLERVRQKLLRDKMTEQSIFGAQWNMLDLVDYFSAHFLLYPNPKEAFLKEVARAQDQGHDHFLAYLKFSGNIAPEITTFLAEQIPSIEGDKLQDPRVLIPHLRKLFDREMIERLLAFRTDLDSLTESESNIVENFGYLTSTMRCAIYLDPIFEKWKPGIKLGSPRFEWPVKEEKYFAPNHVIPALKYSDSVLWANTIGKIRDQFY